MDVSAFNFATVPAKLVKLGSIVDAVWTNGFRRSQERTLQVSRPIGAAAPNVFDRITRMENFQFAAGQSFATLGEAVIAMATWPDAVPTLAHLSFAQGNQIVWLGHAGISRVELMEKRGVLVVFGYTVVGGTWSKSKPF